MSDVYTKAEVYANSLKLFKSTDVKVDRNSNMQKVFTFGGVGVTMGIPETSISLTNMVPSEDFELDPEALGMFKGKTVDLTIVAGGRTLTCTGWFENDSFSYAINGNASQTIAFWGGEAVWQ